MTERDPRIDPRPGDVLKRGKSTRTLTVDELWPLRGLMLLANGSKWSNHRKWMTLHQWEQWAKTATVIKRAP